MEVVLTVADHWPDSIWGKSSAQVHPRVIGLGADVVLFLGKFVIVRDAGMDK